MRLVCRRRELRRPASDFLGSEPASNYGHNTYHGMTARVEKRYSSGMTVNAFYTRSKPINDVDEDGGAGGVTFYNRRLEKARAAYDVNTTASTRPIRLSISWTVRRSERSTAPVGSFSDVGTGRWHGIMVFRLDW